MTKLLAEIESVVERYIGRDWCYELRADLTEDVRAVLKRQGYRQDTPVTLTLDDDSVVIVRVGRFLNRN